jgi:hypothetical protein
MSLTKMNVMNKQLFRLLSSRIRQKKYTLIEPCKRVGLELLTVLEVVE